MPTGVYKRKPFTEQAKRNMSLAKKGKPFSGVTYDWRGKKATIEHRRKNSEAHKGEKSQTWKGGVTAINEVVRGSLEYRLWRQAVFQRDLYRCVWCGCRGSRKKKIHADHIKPFAFFPELRFAIDNGRTLCEDCHMKTSTWGKTKRT